MPCVGMRAGRVQQRRQKFAPIFRVLLQGLADGGERGQAQVAGDYRVDQQARQGVPETGNVDLEQFLSLFNIYGHYFISVFLKSGGCNTTKQSHRTCYIKLRHPKFLLLFI